MVRFSNGIIGILNFLTFLLSIPILGGGIWLATRGSTDCEKFLQMPVIAIGVFLMVVSLAGIIGACCRLPWLMWLYLMFLFLLILLLFCITIFALVVTGKGAGTADVRYSGQLYNEESARLADYSNWLQKRVEKASNWNKIKSCIHDAKICKSLAADDTVNALADQFYQKHLSPIQSGCCKPPPSCGLTFANTTIWNSSVKDELDPDCGLWNNEPGKLCYDCKSCKAGLLANLKRDWRKVAIINFVVLIFLIVISSIGCCAFSNNRRDSEYAYAQFKMAYGFP
eukprot:Gb_25195 [translate_table: standard]